MPFSVLVAAFSGCKAGEMSRMKASAYLEILSSTCKRDVVHTVNERKPPMRHLVCSPGLPSAITLSSNLTTGTMS